MTTLAVSRRSVTRAAWLAGLLALAATMAHAEVYVWKPKQGGSWSAAANWTSTVAGFPNANDAEAEFRGNLNVNQAVVTIAGNYALNRLLLESMTPTQSYLLRGANAQGQLTLNGTFIHVTEDNRAPHTIAVPLRILDNTGVIVRNDSVGVDANTAPARLTISGAISGNQVGLSFRSGVDVPAEVLLTGNSTFKGRVQVSTGAYLAIDKDAALGDASNSVGLTSATLQGRAGATLGQARTVTLGGRPVLAGDDTSSDLVFQVDGKLTGTGSPTILDSVRLTNPANDFGAALKVIFVGNGSQAGSLRLIRPDVLGAAAKIVMADGQLVAEESFTLPTPLQLDLNGRVRVEPDKTLTTTGQIGGIGRLIKQGRGTLVLANDGNSQRGNTINAGVLAFSKDSQLGLAGRGILIRSGGVLRADAPLVTPRDIRITDFGRLRANIAADPKKPFEVGGVISGGELIKDGAGTLLLSAINTHDSTVISEGSLAITSNTGLGKRDGPLTLVGDGVLRVSGTFFTDRPIFVRNSRPGDSAGIWVDKGNTVVLNTGITAGQAQFTKSGEGTLFFNTGSNTTIGTRAKIVAGELSIARDAIVSVGTGLFNGAAGKLKGAGKLVGKFNNQGRVNGGGDPGTLSIEGDVEMEAGSIFELDINSALGAAGQTQGWGLMDITGGMALHGPLSLELRSFTQSGLAGALAPGLFDANSPYRWEFARASDGIGGFAADLILVDASAFQNPLPAGAQFSVEQSGASLFVVYDPTAAVPEPAAGLLMALGLLVVTFARRARA